MAGYRGAAGKGTKIIGGKRYNLWGWLTTNDKQKYQSGKDTQLNKIKQTHSIRVLGNNAPYAVWIRGK